VAIGLPGDRKVDMKRLEAQFAPAEIEEANEVDLAPIRNSSRDTSDPGSWDRSVMTPSPPPM